MRKTVADIVSGSFVTCHVECMHCGTHYVGQCKRSSWYAMHTENEWYLLLYYINL